MTTVFQWREFNQLSTDLLSHTISPGLENAVYRTCVSRSYYAAFHIALEYGEENEFESWKCFRSIHNELINYFAVSSNPEERLISLNLDRIRKERVIADYESSLDSNPCRWAEKAIKESILVINEIDLLST